jgi:eukaryotic-like serine/threonine-protein kinase
MDAVAIKRAHELFQAAADLPRHDRAAFLRGRCEDDSGLLEFVEQMLSDHERESSGPLDAPLLDGQRGMPLAMPALPTRLGGYELVSVLGEGGMAVVYEARQQNPSRVVALKVLRPGVLSAELLRRFEHEIQVLGQLQHEGIAHIYEAGVAEASLADGSKVRQPYFAMELIRGEPLNLFAIRNKLSDDQKLELVAKVCDAVQYAHQKGVIHRDLKPGNILVESEGATRHGAESEGGKDEGRSRGGTASFHHGPRPKVLDFGVARVTGAEFEGQTMATQAGRLIGTLSYMSPEQVGGEVEETDTRSDVYSLGVILYELLSGRLPHELRELPLVEAARRVQEQEPVRLAAIDKRLRGDIDVIVARAMSKDKARRYAGAMQLAADIRHYLAGEAIEARRDSAVYVVRKSLGRHRALAGVGGALLVGLIAFAAYAWIQSAKEHKARVNQEHVNKFLAGIIELANPDPSRGYSLTLTDMLDDATHRLEKGELAGDPDVEAQVRKTIAQTYDNLELIDGEILHRLWLAEYHRKRGGDNSQEYLDALTELGNAYVEAGHEPQGLEVLKKGLTLAQSIHGERSLAAYKLMDTIGNSLMRDGRSQEALDLALAATQGVESLLGPDDIETGGVYFNLGGVYRGLGKTQEMTECYERALKIMESASPGNVGTIRLRWTYAQDVLRRGRRLDEAETLLRRALEIAIGSLGADHPETLMTQKALAGILYDKKDYDQAKQILTKALETCRGLRRWASQTEAALAASLAFTLKAKGELNEAAEMLRASIARFERARGRADRLVLNLIVILSGVERDRSGREMGAALLGDAAQRLVDDGKGDDPRVAEWRKQAAAMRAGN